MLEGIEHGVTSVEAVLRPPRRRSGIREGRCEQREPSGEQGSRVEYSSTQVHGMSVRLRGSSVNLGKGVDSFQLEMPGPKLQRTGACARTGDLGQSRCADRGDTCLLRRDIETVLRADKLAR